jgi:peptidoglycan/xylan/chitin deacetylase (PgdA/CDA1 family)
MAATDDRRDAWLVGGALAAAAGYWLPSIALVSAAGRRLFGVRATIDAPAAVALTFDDGPHPQGTPAVLAALEQARAPATFFLAGEQVERWPTLAAEIVAAGHEVGVHCQRHRNLMRLTPRQVRDDLLRAADVIATATGRDPHRYRPPYGILTTPALVHSHRMKWDVVLWRRDGADWDARATPASISARILRHLAPGRGTPSEPARLAPPHRLSRVYLPLLFERRRRGNRPGDRRLRIAGPRGLRPGRSSARVPATLPRACEVPVAFEAKFVAAGASMTLER